jgi:hypothetical protein
MCRPPEGNQVCQHVMLQYTRLSSSSLVMCACHIQSQALHTILCEFMTLHACREPGQPAPGADTPTKRHRPQRQQQCSAAGAAGEGCKIHRDSGLQSG